MRPRSSCRERIDCLDRDVAGALGAGERKAFEAHLAPCLPCAGCLDGYRRSIAPVQARAEAEEEASREAPGELVTAVLAALRRTRAG